MQCLIQEMRFPQAITAPVASDNGNHNSHSNTNNGNNLSARFQRGVASSPVRRNIANDATDSVAIRADHVVTYSRNINCNNNSNASESSPDEDSFIDDETLPYTSLDLPCGGIINPNYPGFQEFAHTLGFDTTRDDSEISDDDSALSGELTNQTNQHNDNHNQNNDDNANHNPVATNININRETPRIFIEKEKKTPDFDGNVSVDQGIESDLEAENNEPDRCTSIIIPKVVVTPDAFRTPTDIVGDLSGEIEREIGAKFSDYKTVGVGVGEQPVADNKVGGTDTMTAVTVDRPLNNKMADAFLSCATDQLPHKDNRYVVSKEKEPLTTRAPEKEADSMVPRKKEKMQINMGVKRGRCTNQTQQGRRERRRTSPDDIADFDVYNIETAMPVIDLDAIESHLKAAREEERRRRTDREEIRRRLAMGPDPDDFYDTKPGRKPSLHARLQSGMNLQICFMNETVSDGESPTSDSPDTPVTPRTPGLEAVSPVKPTQLDNHPYNSRPLSVNINENNTAQQNGNIKNGNAGRPGSLSIGPPAAPMTEADFFARQARLQVEARMALAQAKEMAHMQMEVERQEHHNSPVTEVVRNALQKVGVPSPEQHRRVSRRLLTGMNVAQLQVVVCELHGQIETLNEQLVRLLMERDELHMGQDSMLVDIEDLTRYLGAKEQTVREQKKTAVSQPPRQQQQNKHTKLLRIPGITRK